MHPNSLEALRIGREKAFAKRAALNIGEQNKLKKELATLKKAENIKKRVEEIKDLRLKVVNTLKEEPEPKRATESRKAKVRDDGPPSDSEDCPEAVDWKTFYKSKYKAKLAAQKEPEYAALARDKLRQQATARAQQLAWQSMFPGVQFPPS